MASKKFSHAKKTIFVLTLLSFNAFSADVKTLEDIDILQGETIYYRALATRNDAKLKAGADGNYSSSSAPLSNNQEQRNPSAMLPVVDSIMGNDKGLIARIRYADGQTTMNRVGDIINGNLRITKINLQGVTVVSTQNGQAYSLKEGGN